MATHDQTNPRLVILNSCSKKHYTKNSLQICNTLRSSAKISGLSYNFFTLYGIPVKLHTMIEHFKMFYLLNTYYFLTAGFEQLNNVLTPKMKAFQLGVKQLQGHLDAVYDVTIAYSNTRDSKTGERILAPGMPGKGYQNTLY